MRRNKSRAQTTLEYAVILAVILAAFFAMRQFFKRSIAGNLRESTDKIGDQYVAGGTSGYYATEQLDEMGTRERYDAGNSSYRVTDPATTNFNATETITDSIANEKLF